MKIIAITQARTGSSRLPNKVLKRIEGQSLLEIHLQRIQQSQKIQKTIVATTTKPQDSAIVQAANQLRIISYQGSENDVLDRFYQAAKKHQPDYVVRLTSDCPLIDPVLIDKVIDYTISEQLDYCSNTLDTNYPDGQDVEVFKFSALEKAWNEAQLQSEREHVTPYIWKNSTYKGGSLFQSDNFYEGENFGDLRMTVDEQKDFVLMQNLIETLGVQKAWKEYAIYLRTHPTISNINADITRNEGLLKSMKND